MTFKVSNRCLLRVLIYYVAPTFLFSFCLVVRKDGYQLNDVLDVCDTVHKWMEGRIVGMDPKKGYFINYVGWSEKWNEWIPKNSNRLAPSGNE